MLTSAQIDKLINKIITEYQPEKIILFGSYAEGRANEDSDLDLFIIKQTDDKFFDRIRKVRRVMQPQPIALDILVYTPDEFEQKKNWINHIAYIANNKGKVIYERKHKKLA